jgi:hypothetical protein
MRFSAHYIAGVAAVALALGMGVAQAGELTNLPGQAGKDDMGVGIGVICNTSAQAEAYVILRNGGAEITPAVDSVNAKEHDPRACGVAAVAFKRGKTMETKNQNGKLVSIVRINVLAGFDGQKWSPVPDMVQYAVIQEQGVAI